MIYYEIISAMYEKSNIGTIFRGHSAELTSEICFFLTDDAESVLNCDWKHENAIKIARHIH